jgi:large subunit ribosomal protein L5
MSYLPGKYKKEVVSEMMKKFGYKSVMAVPKIKKVVINTGFGRAVAGKTPDEQKKVYTGILEDLNLIAGQKPVLTAAKKSVASFKIRQGQPVGAAVTLRRSKMYDFLERFIQITLPRSKDFQGLDKKCFDKSGNMAIGIKEQIIFPEISTEKSKSIFGLQIIVATTAKNTAEGMELLRLMGFPIKQ